MATVIVTPDYQWSNEHNNVNKRVLRRYQINNNTATKWRDGLQGIQQMLAETRARSERLRSYGGKWSLSDVAICNDSVHDSKPLTYWASIPARFIAGGGLFNDPLPLEKRLFFFQSGAQVSQVNRALEERGLSLPTSGASNGQTLAGAVSTGTHGSAMKIGAMQDYVRAMHIVTKSDDHVLLQPSSAPVANQDLADLFGARLVTDDELFYAAVVSFGAFGVIHGLIIEVVSLYSLEVHNKFVDLDIARKSLPLLASFDHNSTTNLSSILQQVGMPSDEDPYHFEIVINPYKDSNNAFMRVMYRRPYDPSTLDPEPGSSGSRVGDDVLTIIGSLADSASFAIPLLVNTLFDRVGEEVSGYTQTHRNVFGDSTLYRAARGTASTEIGVPIDRAEEAIDIVRQASVDDTFAGVIACRFVKPSKATLAFTRFGPLTCTIELPGLNSDATQQYFNDVFGRLDAAGIPFTLHWGQQGDYSAMRLDRMYGDAVDAWMNARQQLLPDPMQRYMFTNDFMKRCGLSEPAPLTGGDIIV